MKNILLILSLFIITFINSYSQCDESIINDLIYSGSSVTRAYGSKLIAECQLVEYGEELVNMLEGEEHLYTASFYLTTLESLNWEDIDVLAEQFLERVDGMITETYDDVLESKVIAARILIRNDDFSFFQFVTQIVKRDRPNLTFETIYCLLQVLATGTQQIGYAKNELINLVSNANDYMIKATALKGLIQYPDNDVLNLLISVVQNDDDWAMRNEAYVVLLSNYYNSQQQLLRLQSAVDPEKTNRLTFARRLLADWGLPADLYTVIENLQNETDPDVIIGLDYLNQNFIPPNPVGLPLDTMIINLISYTDELYQYGWIENEETYNYYTNSLTDFIELLNSGLYEKACVLINEEMPIQIESDFESELITIEGYKFLHYHTIYISERMEELLGPCE
jgi:hypothetical protein